MTEQTADITQVGYGDAAYEEEHLDTEEFLTFGVDGTEYGIPILHVQEIIGYQAPNRIPNAPIGMAGVVNIRGDVIPVVDIRTLFNRPKGEYDTLSVIIVSNINGFTVGSVVDQVNDVLSFTENQLHGAPEVTDGMREEYVTGLGRLDSREVILLDMEQVFDGVESILDLIRAQEERQAAEQ